MADNDIAITTPPSRETRARLPTLDILRGLAIIGTFASNVWLFASVVGTADPATYSLASIASWIPNGKFVGLLTILFGIGIAIQFQTARRSGARWPGSYLVRCVLLFIDGLLNFFLIVTFDVLRYYAVAAFIVAFLILFSDRIQWVLFTVFGGIHVWGLVSVAQSLQRVPNEEIVDRGVLDTRTVPSADVITLSGPSYFETVKGNFSMFSTAFNLTLEYKTFLFYVGALFLLGGLLYRRGILDERGTSLRRFAIGVGAVSLVLDFYTGVVSRSEFGGFSRYFFSVGVALGILAAVVEFYRWRPRVGFLGTALSYVGRMALSCYLLQNILGVVAERTILNSPWFDGSRQEFVAIGLWLVVSVILVLFSWGWLRLFSRGPMELVWHFVFTKITKRNRALPQPLPPAAAPNSFTKE